MAPAPSLPFLRRSIEKELDITRQLVRRIERRSAEVIHAKPNKIILMKTAGYLHSFCYSLEKVFRIVAENVDHDLPRGKNQAVKLIRQMTRDIEGVRPSVLTPQVASQLEAYLTFRLLVHKADLLGADWNVLIPKIGDVRILFARVESSVKNLLVKLESMEKGEAEHELDQDDLT